jgi:hypothetical protein
MDFITVYPSYRSHIHPLLEITEEIDCKIYFDRASKLIIMDYDISKQSNSIIYRKTIMTPDPNYIKSIVKEFLNK